MPGDVIAELEKLERFDGDKLSDTAQLILDAALGEIQKTVTDLLSLVKYHLRHFDVREEFYSVKSQSWRASTGNWREIPTTFSISHDDFSNQPLDARTFEAVQNALTAGTNPLAAMRHLHRAKLESQPHHKWIDATIAAELAVKEVLCRAHPSMEALLIEVQSPPFSKMYGKLLKQYLGEESPFRAKLIKGQERRNELVHRPNAVDIDRQEANDYVSVVEAAIFHMLALLYPDDQLIRQAKHYVGS